MLVVRLQTVSNNQSIFISSLLHHISIFIDVCTLLNFFFQCFRPILTKCGKFSSSTHSRRKKDIHSFSKRKKINKIRVYWFLPAAWNLSQHHLVSRSSTHKSNTKSLQYTPTPAEMHTRYGAYRFNIILSQPILSALYFVGHGTWLTCSKNKRTQFYLPCFALIDVNSFEFCKWTFMCSVALQSKQFCTRMQIIDGPTLGGTRTNAHVLSRMYTFWYEFLWTFSWVFAIVWTYAWMHERIRICRHSQMPVLNVCIRNKMFAFVQVISL